MKVLTIESAIYSVKTSLVWGIWSEGQAESLRMLLLEVEKVKLLREENKGLRDRIEELEDKNKLRELEEWGEDYGDCLWWKLPIEEPPYCGTPLDENFPNYVTHFTKLSIPNV